MTKVTVANGRSGVTKMSSREIATLTGKQRFNCYSAGLNSQGVYEASGGDLYAASEYSNPSGAPPGASMGPPGVIDTNVYDTYYRQALGV